MKEGEGMKNKLLVLGLIVLAFFIISSNLGKDELKNNYYLEINKDIIANNELETGEYSWSKFLEAQDIVDSNTDVVVNDILTGNNGTSLQNDALLYLIQQTEHSS